MSSISIITPTIRPEGLEIVKKGLDRSIIPYEEWLIGSSFEPKYGKWVKDDFTGGIWTLNRCLNKLIKEAKGDLIVSIQDYTFFAPDALDKFNFYYKQDSRNIISGIGDKYEEVYPERGKKVWVDPRRDVYEKFSECPFHYIEGNFCAIPKQAFIDIGGFDESMDFIGFGLDFYSLLDRLDIQGKYKFYIDQTNESYSLTHGRVKDWDERNIDAQTYKGLREKYVINPVLSYL